MSLRQSESHFPVGFWQRPLRTLTWIWIFATLLLAFMGPFGMFHRIPMIPRLAYWGSIIGFSIALALAMRIALLEIMGRDRHPFAVDAVMIPLFNLAYTPPLFYLNERISNFEQPFTLWQTGLVVLTVSVAMIGLREYVGRHSSGLRHIGAARSPVQPASSINTPSASTAEQALRDADAPEVADWGGEVPLLARLPDGMRGELHVISGADHYVDVRTHVGVASVLLRFSDAMRELGDSQGLQVHRSHWVADAAVEGLRRDGHRQFVVLKCGNELPVSRTFAPAAAERWG